MSSAEILKPKSMVRPKHWSEEVENAYRFQLAGYRDVTEYKAIHNVEDCERWPDSGFVKKLKRKEDGYFYYYNRTRECQDKDINKTKMYSY
ncbi:meiosis expressed gene 1 protein homolog [Lingula anatina]|uniref:Meiosis expressed gene 1 protein homolog n=1 Tax=Lingula anatina TaxID=7574 RepID=A0A1S3HXV0_LINAN|nr:meiosis expressed gene 1 protein homolog [Lingula anatina]XP_013390838.1 meiosis expressed gene 1 protein homolog [Lingula anatina]XP_013396101.1 meiosis expressed gene 1 protein homolog [Lingula anatina]XP_013396102.1 meiosis expressed gene 1 protein homolog [Lingula anatina]|eukprot:XP_013390836.1 meiosis expressed gene 1 protein homolog [Lingula anatina]